MQMKTYPLLSSMAQAEAAWTSGIGPSFPVIRLISRFPREGGWPALRMTSPDITVPDGRSARGCPAHLLGGLTA